MGTEKIQADQFLSLSKDHPVFDVRSPAEFLHAHIPGAHNLPLFSDEERKLVGTAYKQQSKQQAIKTGLDFFGTKMRGMVEEVERIVASCQVPVAGNQSRYLSGATGYTVLVHCWRGGMRSAAVAWLLDLYGYKVYTLAGGYKSFRNRVLRQFEKPVDLKILGGYTGSGKTVLIEEMQRNGQPVINLEALANHKGSAFGALGEKPQPSQEMFENLLAIELAGNALVNQNSEGGGAFWIEDESQRIGTLNIPKIFWNKMRNSPVYFIDVPFEERLNYLVANYGIFSKEDLLNAIVRIQNRLGGLETKNAVKFLLENDFPECFRILLRYYDKCYSKGLYNRDNFHTLFYKIGCEAVSVNNLSRLSSANKEKASF